MHNSGRFIVFRFLVLMGAVWLCPRPVASAPVNIEFGGLTWGLRQTSGPVDPGPNTFSNMPDQVWVDERGRLHLSIKKRGGVWTASELMAKEAAGYGSYSITTDDSILSLDPNMVFGFFSWDKAPEQFNREIDVEVSKWGNVAAKAGYFTVQPYDAAGHQHSFELFKASTHRFEMRWEKSTVRFAYIADGKERTSWTYAGAVPDPGRAKLRINFWLFRGVPPVDGRDKEVVITGLTWEPSTR